MGRQNTLPNAVRGANDVTPAGSQPGAVFAHRRYVQFYGIFRRMSRVFWEFEDCSNGAANILSSPSGVL